MSQSIGLIGLGNAGSALAEALLRHGPVTGFDLSAERCALADGIGVKTTESVEQVAAAADRVILSLPKPEASVATVEALLAAPRRPTLIIEASTVTPGTAQACAALCGKADVAFADAAVAGGVASMKAGKITFFLGGAEPDKAKAREVLDPVSERIFDLGPVGGGMGAKVVHNGVMHALMVVLAEAFAMSTKLGVPERTMFDILAREEGLMRPLVHRVKERMLNGDYAGGMSVANARKDSQLALETAQELGVPLFATLAAHTPYEIAEAKGLGDLDYAALAKLWEEWAGVSFRQEDKSIK